jgi:uncharacterized protein (TIRG00374 family)
LKKSALVKGLLKYALAVALLVFVVSMNWSGLKDLFSRDPDLGALALAAVIMAVCTAIQYYRWYLLVRALDLPFTLRNAVRLGLVGTFYNTFLPGSVGGDLVKAFFIAKGHPTRRPAAVATVIADRLVGLFGLLLYAAAVGVGCWAAGNEKFATNPKLQTIVLVCVGLTSALVIGYLGIGLISHKAADRVAGRLHSVRKVGPTLAELWFTVRTYRQRPGTVLTVVALSAVVHTGFVLMFHLGVRVFAPTDLSQLGTLPEHFVIAPIGFIVQALIPVPGGLGGGELTFGGLYNLIRPGQAEIGLAGRLAIRLIEWGLGLIGYLAYLQMRDELPVEEAEKAEEKADPLSGKADEKAA